LEPTRAVSANVELVKRVVDGEDVLDLLLGNESGAVRDHGVPPESRSELGQAGAHCESERESARLDEAPKEGSPWPGAFMRAIRARLTKIPAPPYEM